MLHKLTLNEIKLLGVTHFYGVLKNQHNVIESFKLESNNKIKYWDTHEDHWEGVNELYFKDCTKYLFVLEDNDE